MSSWVIPSSAERPENVGIGFEHHVWGMKKHRSIARGDLIYFWQSKASFVALGVATTDVVAAEPDDAPWNDGVEYTHRFGLTLLSDAPTSAPSWTQVANALGVGGSIQGPRPFDDSAQEAALRSYFTRGGPADLVLPEHRLDIEGLSQDQRRHADVSIPMRDGQAAFRQQLESAYGHACAVTGTRVPRTLEAAHIVQFRGIKSHDVRNGLLLRADVHRLFDAGLLDVVPSSGSGFTVELDPSLYGDPTYSHLHGRALLQPTSAAGPDPAALQRHREEVGRRGTA